MGCALIATFRDTSSQIKICRRVQHVYVCGWFMVGFENPVCGLVRLLKRATIVFRISFFTANSNL